MTLSAALLAALLAAEIAAVALAWRRVVPRPLLALLAFALVDELAVEALHQLVFAGAPRPLAGWARAAWHLETLFVLGWPALLASTARGLSGARRGALVGSYAGMVGALVLVYPLPTARLRWALLAWEVVMVGLAWWGLWRARARTWGAAEVVLVVLVACETMVALVGPFASDPFTRWWIARCFYLAAWAVVGGVLGTMTRPS